MVGYRIEPDGTLQLRYPPEPPDYLKVTAFALAQRQQAGADREKNTGRPQREGGPARDTE